MIQKNPIKRDLEIWRHTIKTLPRHEYVCLS